MVTPELAIGRDELEFGGFGEEIGGKVVVSL